MKKKRLIILGAVIFVLVASSATTLALRHKEEPKSQANIALADSSSDTEQTPETSDSETIKKDEPKTATPKVATTENETEPTPETPTAPEDDFYDYLNPSLKDRLSNADEEKTRQCFLLGVEISKERNNFTNIEKIAQVSKQLSNPCGNGNNEYTPNGKFVYSYVDWCMQRAEGKSVPPVVSAHIAARMCAGF